MTSSETEMTPQLSAEERDELRALAEALEAEGNDGPYLAVASPQTVLSLLATIAALEAEVARYREALAWHAFNDGDWLGRERALAALATPTSPQDTRRCNRHADCDEAEVRYRAFHPDAPSYPSGTLAIANFHCYDDDCEDCFGK